jgi:GNAT superfamily N-acetyltransferase
MIRKATPADCPEIGEFVVDIRYDTVPMVHDDAGVAWYVEHILVARDSAYVYEVAGEVVALLDVDDGWVNQLYCKRGSTGQGIGKTLLDFAKRLSPEGLQLWTFQVNYGARSFYEREGFVEVEKTDGANCEEKQPDVRLEWKP